MNFRNLFGLLLVAALSWACSFPLSSETNARVAFNISFPASLQPRGERLLAAETARLQVTVETAGQNQVMEFTPTAAQAGGKTASVVFSTTPGKHQILVRGLDTAGKTLTAAEISANLVVGNNNLSITLTPPDALALGASRTLAAGEVAYYTVPASLGSQVAVSGVGSVFWEVAADGTFTGEGAKGALVVNATGADKYLRVKQSSAGAFSLGPVVANASTSITVNWDFPLIPTLPGGQLPLLISFFTDAPAIDLTVAPGLQPGWSLVEWRIDDFVDYGYDFNEDGSYESFEVDGGGNIRINPDYLLPGVHDLELYVTDSAGHLYVATFNFTVTYAYYQSQEEN